MCKAMSYEHLEGKNTQIEIELWEVSESSSYKTRIFDLWQMNKPELSEIEFLVEC